MSDSDDHFFNFSESDEEEQAMAMRNLKENLEEIILSCRKPGDSPVSLLATDDSGRSTAEILVPDIQLMEAMTLIDTCREYQVDPEEIPENESTLIEAEKCIVVEGVRFFYDETGRLAGFTAQTNAELLVWHSSYDDNKVGLKFAWLVMNAAVTTLTQIFGEVFSITCGREDYEETPTIDLYYCTLPIWNSEDDGFISFKDEVLATETILNNLLPTLEEMVIPNSIKERIGIDYANAKKWGVEEKNLYGLYCIAGLEFAQLLQQMPIDTWAVSVNGLYLTACVDDSAHISMKLELDASDEQQLKEKVREIVDQLIVRARENSGEGPGEFDINGPGFGDMFEPDED